MRLEFTTRSTGHTVKTDHRKGGLTPHTRVMGDSLYLPSEDVPPAAASTSARILKGPSRYQVV